MGMIPRDVTGFLLAGGRSSRMAPPPGGEPQARPIGPDGQRPSPPGGGVGRDKALLPIGSHTLIELVIQHLRPCVGRIVVIGHPDNAPLLEQRLQQRILTDALPHEGPLMGIYTGLLHTDTALNVFVPCDMPWVEERLLERLMGACSVDTPVVASRHPLEGVQPFPLICHSTAGRLIGALLNQHERSLQALLRQPGTRVIPIPETDWWRSFMNVNTRSDYALLSHETT